MSIRRGNAWRRQVEVWLQDHLFVTTVRGLGYKGDDIGAVHDDLDLSVECKNHRAHDFAGWVDQAEGNADADQIPVVIAHRRGHTSVDRAYVVMSGRAFARLLTHHRRKQ